MKLLKYLILVLVICNIPSILKVGLGSAALGSVASTLTYGLMLLYYFLSQKKSPAWLLIIFAITYFTISGYVGVINETYYFRDFIKFLIIVICGGEVVRNTTINELFVLLLIGSTSILIHATVFADDYGRYSGFYLDPNSGSFVCLLGCCTTYSIKNEKWRLISLFYITFCGVLTFSRSFFLLWFLMSVIATIQNRKHIKAIGLGFTVLLLIISLSTILQFNTKRLSLLEDLLGNNSIETYEDKNADSRTETWALYYDDIISSPIFGNGYLSFTGTPYQVGVHNSYLRILGEAGIFALLTYLLFYTQLFYLSLKTFREEVFKTLLVLAIMTLLLTIHNFDSDDYITFISLWLYFSLIHKNKPIFDPNMDLYEQIKT